MSTPDICPLRFNSFCSSLLVPVPFVPLLTGEWGALRLPRLEPERVRAAHRLTVLKLGSFATCHRLTVLAPHPSSEGTGSAAETDALLTRTEISRQETIVDEAWASWARITRVVSVFAVA